MVNMAVEAGAKNGILNPDRVTEEYLRSKPTRPFRHVTSESDARYVEIKEYDVGGIEPQVAFPHQPGNVKPISEVANIRRIIVHISPQHPGPA